MQQVAARNCLHGAANGARAGVSVLEELFWNAPARSVRFAARCALAACFLHGLCARAAARSRLIVSGVCDAWSDAAVRSIYLLDRIHGGSYAASNTCERSL